MIALPFVYFGMWCYTAYKKRGLDVYVFILLLYTIMSFFSIMIDVLDLYSDSCVKFSSLGFFAPLTYITLLTICIQPFSSFRSNEILSLSGNISEVKFNFVVYVYFTIFCIIFIVSATRLEEILTSNALAQIRGELYTGDAVSFYDHLSGMPRYICAVCSILAPSSFIMIPFFFIGITYFNKGPIFSLITLCGSLTMLLIAINIVDRSNFAYWILSFSLCYIVFRRHFTPKIKRKFYFLTLLIFVILLLYLIAVTVSRFGERDNGASGGVIMYLGQSYINFCNFFNHLIFDAPHKPEIVLLPNINRYIFQGPNYFEFADRLSNTYHHMVSNFSTFIGLIMSVSGIWITVFYCVCFRSLTLLALKRPIVNQINLKQFVLFWIVALNPVLGIFGYYYMSSDVVIAVITWLIISVFVNTSVIRSNKNITLCKKL